MKRHYVVLAFLSFIMFTNISCDEDDNNNNDEQEVEFTSTNYIYEGDLRKYYLETENTRLSNDIEVWQQVPDSDPTYNDVQISIASAIAEIAINNQELESILVPGDQFLIINPTFPPLPSPSPCLCLDVFNSISNIVFQSGNDNGNITITSANQTLLASTANTQTNAIPNTNNLGTYQSFQLSENNFTGQATVFVTTDNASYSVLVNFQNLE